MKHTEIEFKWDANSLRAFGKMNRALHATGASVGSAQLWRITDTYLDTPTRDFEKQHIAFRVRCVRDSWEATFKTRTEIKRGKAVRREETCQLTEAHNLAQALQILRRKKTWKNLPVANLTPLFTLKNSRRTWTVTEGKLRAELAFDTCEISVCGRRVFFKEIELELQHGSVATFEELTARLTEKSGLEPARISKVKTALLLRKLWRGKK